MHFFGYHVIEDQLIALHRKVDSLAETLRFGFSRIMSQLDEAITLIDAATTEIATALEADASAISGLRSQLAAGSPATPAQLAKLENIGQRLNANAARAREIAADPAAPVPELTPTTTPPPTV